MKLDYESFSTSLLCAFTGTDPSYEYSHSVELSKPKKLLQVVIKDWDFDHNQTPKIFFLGLGNCKKMQN